MRYFVLFLISFDLLAATSARVCPDAKHCFFDWYEEPHYSVYRDGEVCTLPLLSDGVCPDYLIGGCALRGECDLDRRLLRPVKPPLFTNNQ